MSILDRFKKSVPAATGWYIESVNTPGVLGLSAGELYRTQANLRAVVSFLADNIADLPIKVYDRASDTDRPRVIDSPAANLLRRPNDTQTTYELVRELVSNLCLYDRAVMIVAKDAKSPAGYQVRLLPDSWLKAADNGGWEPGTFRVTFGRNGQTYDLKPGEYIYFHGYNPASPWQSCSPIDSLRQTLFEQIEAGRFRRQVWARGGRVNTYVVRPKDVAPWSAETAKKWAEQFRSTWTGDGGTQAGGIPLLEDGMDIKTLQVSAKEAQWYESVQLTRSDVAAAYHLNPAIIWHDQAQTYASAKDNARALYADALGPWLTYIAQRLNAFLLPAIGEPEDHYVEFDLRKKLDGSFEERAQVLQTSVGAPWITRNEARAMNNLPAIEGGDELIVPLNVIEGGLASPTDTARDNYNEGNYAMKSDDDVVIAEYDDDGLAERLQAELHAAAADFEIKGTPPEKAQADFEDVYAKFFERQARTVLSRIPKKDAGEPDWFDMVRWTKELADDLEPLVMKETEREARRVVELLGIDPDTYSVPLTAKYLRKLCESRARAANATMMAALMEDVQSEEPDPRHVYEAQAPALSERCGSSIAHAVTAFAIMEGIQQATNNGAQYRSITKTWRTGANPRNSHAAMNGETVPYDGVFSNGARFPQDVSLDAAESANCNCTVDVRVKR